MEEAYSELYQQFLRLRSLCLRQAALLHQLATALQKQQDATLPNGELSDMMSISVQCTQTIPEDLQEKPEPQLATAHKPATQCGVDGLSRNVGKFSDLLALDMSKLRLDGACQRNENLELEPLLSLDSLGWQGASSKVSKNLLQADLPSGDTSMLTRRMPVTDRRSLVNDFLSQCDGLLMSDVALQSHVCEFCQAVFPATTTTGGEFLRHLYTHIT